MTIAYRVRLYFLVSWLIMLISGGAFSATFTFVNQCSYTVWPGILSNAGTPQLSTTGFALGPGGSVPIPVPSAWSGRMWGRTFCSQNPTSGKFTCVTGDCGSGNMECSGGGAEPPATLAEFTLNGADGLDFYDVSLVDGYNLPMLVVPKNGDRGNCTVTGCIADLNAACPSDLKVTNDDGASVACKSACEAFEDPQYCCSGEYATPDTCRPTAYSELFKNACPRAYSYAYDDGSSTFTCASADYDITFCPTPSASNKKSSGGKISGSSDSSLSSSAPSYWAYASVFITFLSVSWQLWAQPN
ncbi:thaumatin-like protein 1 [Primulina eburnea]|uniref:thaumatin-like protein 1 n=1 Tax=Primulina eburnea TaxID=1245227 RepID=UPI003C6C0A15